MKNSALNNLKSMAIKFAVVLLALTVSMVFVSPSTAADNPLEVTISTTGSISFNVDIAGTENATSFALVSGAFTSVVTCNPGLSGPTSWTCTGVTSEIENHLDQVFGGPNWGSTPQFSLKVRDSNSNQLASQLVHITDLRSVTLSSLVVTAPTQMVLRGQSDQKIKFAAAAINLRGSSIASNFRFELDGKLLFASKSPVLSATKEVLVKTLTDGSHALRVVSQNSQGTVEDTVIFNIFTPKVTGIRLGSPSSYFPVLDGYQDSLAVTATVNVNTDQNVPGKGFIALQTTSGKVLKSFPITHSGDSRVIFRGKYLGKFQTGKLKMVASYTPLGGKTSTSAKFINASPKKLITTTSKFTVSAWTAMQSCGTSYDPCKRGGYNGSSNGIELYSDPIGADHESNFYVKLPSGTTKWKATFNGLHTGFIAPSFSVNTQYEDEEGDWVEDEFLGSMPSKADWAGSWTTSWAHLDPGNRMADFYLSATDWGTLFFDSITFTCVQVKLG